MKNYWHTPLAPGAMTPAEKTRRTLQQVAEAIIGGAILAAPFIMIAAFYIITH